MMQRSQSNAASGLLMGLLLSALAPACGDSAAEQGDVADTAEVDTDGVDTAGADDTGGPAIDTSTPAPPRCETVADCDDGIACTVDSCGADGVCAWTVEADTCFIFNVCRAAGEVSVSSPCEVCEPSVSATSWSPAGEGAACTSVDPCVVDATCSSGVCAGSPRVCEDSNDCTRDRCDSISGCVFEALSGDACDDGTVCTEDNVCVAGVCTGALVDCDDGSECTDDSCDPLGGCINEPVTSACDDGDACTVGDVCDAGACTSGAVDDCDDGNICTFDFCEPLLGCAHLPTQSPCCQGLTSVCDDNDPCTDDLCDPATGGCAYEQNTSACDDGDPCTDGDVCAAGVCAGQLDDCDDGNPCTDDSCSTTAGCVQSPISGAACDDGMACSTGDVCSAGVCAGDMSGCTCTPTLDPDAVKLNAVAIGTTGFAGDGVDVDQDGATCAPPNQCGDGVDNTLGIIAPFANDPFADAVATGSVLLIMTVDSTTPGPVNITLFQGELDPANSGCDFQTQTCDYLADTGLFDPATCEPLVSIPATLTGDQLVGGGPGTILPFSVPFSADATLDITLFNLRVEATVVTGANGLTAIDGILGGAVPKEQLIEALEGLPDDALPIPKAQVVTLLNTLVSNDIDTTGDGTKDAASIGLTFMGIDANLTGIAP